MRSKHDAGMRRAPDSSLKHDEVAEGVSPGFIKQAGRFLLHDGSDFVLMAGCTGF
jgi:hypothetical protein